MACSWPPSGLLTQVPPPAPPPPPPKCRSHIYRCTKASMASASSCVKCGDEGAPCCVTADGKTSSCNNPDTDLCVNHYCTKSSGEYQSPCDPANSKCDTAKYPGLACVAAPESSGFSNWCDCNGGASQFQLCKDGFVCGPGSQPTPGDVPNCSTLTGPNYIDWKGKCTKPQKAGTGFAGAGLAPTATKPGGTNWLCDLPDTPASRSAVTAAGSTWCKWDLD